MSSNDYFYNILLNELPDISQKDVYYRLKSTFPEWCGNINYGDPQVLNIVFAAYIASTFNPIPEQGSNFYGIYNLLQYILKQLRLGPGQDNFMTDFDQLNLFAQDFFGPNLPRLYTDTGPETNLSYKKRISANLFKIKDTRQAMSDAILALTGQVPVIYEPWRPADTGCYGGLTSTNYTMGYGTAGKYGSGSYPYQAFIDVFLPVGDSMANYPGLMDVTGCLASTNTTNYVMGYGNPSLRKGEITVDQVYQVINATKVFGTLIWVNIVHGTSPLSPQYVLDANGDFIVDGNSETVLD